MLGLRSRSAVGKSILPARRAQGSRLPAFRFLVLGLGLGALLVQAALLYRFFLQLTGNSADGALSSALYGLSMRLVEPFRSIEPSQHRTEGVVELATLAAIDAYLAIALGLIAATLAARLLWRSLIRRR